jgi:hypothetical protein
MLLKSRSPSGRNWVTIKSIRIDVGDNSHDELMNPEVKAQLAMTHH